MAGSARPKAEAVAVHVRHPRSAGSEAKAIEVHVRYPGSAGSEAEAVEVSRLAARALGSLLIFRL